MAAWPERFSAAAPRNAHQRGVGIVTKELRRAVKVRQPREAEVFADAGHLAEEVDRLPIGFAEFDPERVEREHHPVGEPADPARGRGFVGIRDNFFSFCDRFSGEEAEFGYHNNPSLRFRRR